MSVISKLKVWIGSDTGDLEKGLKKSRKEVSAFGSGMKKLGGLIAGAFAVSSVVSFARECMGLNKIQAAAEKKLAAVIKATGGAAGLTADEMKNYASQLQNVTTWGDEVTIDAMAIMSTFKSIKGEVFKEAIASAQDMATVLNSDLNAAVMQIGKALEAPEIGLNALRRSGVSFSAEQIKQIKKLVAEGKKQEAQLIMLKELQNEFGGAAKAAAADAYGAAEQLTNVWGDFKEAVGSAITPSAESIKFLTERVQENTAVLNDKAIPTWRKWLGFVVPGISSQNKGMALLNLQQKERNEEMLKIMKLSYSDINSLLGKQKWYLGLDDRGKKFYKPTYDAILAELEKRNQGIQALNKKEEKAKELEKERISQKEKEKQAIQAVIDMQENSVKAVGEKIKAYKDLAAATDLNDIAGQAFYKKEMLRLDRLIEKQKSLISSRILPEMKRQEGGPLSKPKQLYGVKEAAVDVRTELVDSKSLKEMISFPDKLEPLSDTLQEIKYDFIDLSGIANSAINDMTAGFTAGLGEMIAAGGNLQGFSSLIAGTFADMAINVGKTAIQTGIAIEGIKLALKSLNPFVAIAAGVALVALGTAVKKSLGNIAKGGSGGTFSSHALSGNSITDTRSGSGIDNAAKPVEVIVRGDFKLKGSTLVAAVEGENSRRNLTT